MLTTGAAGRPAPGSLQVPLWRAIVVFRFASLAYVVVLVLRNMRDYDHPVAAAPALVALIGWTIFTAYGYARPAVRRWPLLGADLLVTAAILLASVWIIGRPALAAGVPTLAVAWQAGPVLSWAVAGGRRAGVTAALILTAADLTVRNSFNQSAITGGMLMLLAGVAVGLFVRLAGRAELQLQQAVELEAATRERERLARDIHDSVLQVLALVQRRGAELEGEAGELARLAGQQEAALRTLISTRAPLSTTDGRADTGSGAGAGGGSSAVVDLRTLIGPYASATVSIAEPATPVALSEPVAREVVAAVGAALDNIARHAGPNVRAWVLIEDETRAVTVSIRDDGPGIAAGRLAEAATQGRLGITQSIQGRIADLNGTTTITSTPTEGTEVELRIPRP